MANLTSVHRITKLLNGFYRIIYENFSAAYPMKKIIDPPLGTKGGLVVNLVVIQC